MYISYPHIVAAISGAFLDIPGQFIRKKFRLYVDLDVLPKEYGKGGRMVQKVECAVWF